MDKTIEQYQTITIESWHQFQELASSLDFRSWAFRGQREEKWGLVPSLSRYLKVFGVKENYWPSQEKRILRIFRRKAHLLLEKVPEELDDFEWLALMQHHGAPTRLLDFTWSPYVAAYFALEQATGDAAVWALHPAKLNNEPMRTLRVDQQEAAGERGPWIRGKYQEVFLPNKERIVYLGEPQRMNQRLIAQSGTFVIPGLLHEPVENLIPVEAIVKIVLTQSVRRRAMAELYNMNIGNATLFPGLDGLARSLAYELEFHWAFDPTTDETYEGFVAAT